MRVMFASTRGAGRPGQILPLADACKRAGHQVLIASPPYLAACREWKPDVIVRETAELGSAVAAELEGIPHARIATGLACTEETAIAEAAPALDALRVAAGLPSDPTGDVLRAAPCFSWFPASLEEPPAPSETIRLRDPEWDSWPIPLPASWWRGSSDPLVYVTFGSGSFAQTRPLFSAAMRALTGLPVRVLMTVGHDVETDALGPVPGNVHIERWVPQGHVLPHAAAVVCHAGSGTTLGALAAGRPLVLLPLFADQPDNARRVAATGAGIVSDTATLRASVVSVLEDRSYRTAAARHAKELRTHVLPSAAIAALAELAMPELRAAA